MTNINPIQPSNNPNFLWELDPEGLPKSDQDKKILNLFLEFSKKADFSDWVSKNPKLANMHFKLLEETKGFNGKSLEDQHRIISKFPDRFTRLTLHTNEDKIAIPTVLLKAKSQVINEMFMDIHLNHLEEVHEINFDMEMNSFAKQFFQYLQGEDILIDKDNDLKLLEIAHHYESFDLENKCLESIQQRLDKKLVFSLLNNPKEHLKDLTGLIFYYIHQHGIRNEILNEKPSFMNSVYSLARTSISPVLGSSDPLFKNEETKNRAIALAELAAKYTDELTPQLEYKNGLKLKIGYREHINMKMFKEIAETLTLKTLVISYKDMTQDEFEAIAKIFSTISILTIQSNDHITQIPKVWENHVRDLTLSENNSIKSVDLKNARVLNFYNCYNLNNVIAPLAENVTILSCPNLINLQVPPRQLALENFLF